MSVDLRQSEKVRLISNVALAGKYEWLNNHLMVLIIYFAILAVFAIIYVFTRVLIGKIDFLSLNFELLTQFSVALYYIYISVIFAVVLKYDNIANYLQKPSEDEFEYLYESGSAPTRRIRHKTKYRYDNTNITSIRRNIIRNVYIMQQSDFLFVLVAFIPVTLLFFMRTWLWSQFDKSIFMETGDVTWVEIWYFTLEIFAKGFFADIFEHFNLDISGMSVDHSRPMFSVFVLVFRTSISFLFIGSVYRIASIKLNGRRFGSRRMTISSILSQFGPGVRYSRPSGSTPSSAVNVIGQNKES